jgi:hypothetical protein
MSILLEFIPSIFAALVLDFILYITGASVLRVVSFGLFKFQIYNYGEFKELKGKPDQGFLLQYIIGLSFYTLIIVAIAWLN